MKVAELIAALSALPPDANVHYIWDGAARSAAQHVYLARNGDVMLADYGDTVYSDDERPADAPTYDENQYWALPLHKDCCPQCGQQFAEVLDVNVCSNCELHSTRDELIDEETDYTWTL